MLVSPSNAAGKRKAGSVAQAGAQPVAVGAGAADCPSGAAPEVRLARGLTLAERELARLKSEAAAARNAAETSLTETKQALEEQRQKAEGLARDLALAQREVERLKTEAAARNAAEASLADTRQALEEQRQKAEGLARDLALAQREVERLKPKPLQRATPRKRLWPRRGRRLKRSAGRSASWNAISPKPVSPSKRCRQAQGWQRRRRPARSRSRSPSR